MKVSLVRRTLRFGKYDKLSRRFFGPYKVYSRIGYVAYRMALPPEFSAMHNIFHVSMLKKYVPDSSHVLRHEPLEIQKDATYVEKPVRRSNLGIEKSSSEEVFPSAT